MLKKSPIVIVAACGLSAALAIAQEASPAMAPVIAAVTVPEKKSEATKPAAAKPTPKPAATTTTSAEAPAAEAAATPNPKKPNFLQRVFGSRKKPVATPEPTSTPVSSPTPSPTPKKTSAKPTATPAPTADGASTPKPAKPTETAKTDVPKAPTATPAKKTTAKGATAPDAKKTAPEPPADADPEVKEKFHFEQAKAKAVEDTQVKALKAKADNAATDEESRKALRAYNKALFEKIRKIDSSVSERATRLEAAILKRLSE